jgi:uncharacterized protein
MIIDLASIGTSRKAIDVSFDPTDIDLDGEQVLLKGKTRLIGETERVAGRAHVRGTLETDVSTDCIRCLEPVAKYLEIRFDDIFVDAGEEDTRTEAEVAAEALDESLVEDGQVVLAEVVREQILLALSEQVFCQDDCKGLCPKCGANLNLIDCKCADDDVDPRWAALENLR